MDAFKDIPPAVDVPSARERARGVHVVHEEPRLGVPTFVWGARPSRAGASRLRPVPPEQAARAHLGQNVELYRLGRTDSAHIPVRGIHRMRTGANIVTFAQEVDGVEVFRQSLKVLMDADNQLVAMSGHLSPVASEPWLAKRAPAFSLEPREAIALAWRDLHGDPLPAVSLSLTGRAQGPYSHYELSPGPRRVVFSSPARVRKVYFPLPGALVPAYYVELDTTPVTETEGDQYAYVISAVDGQRLYRHGLSADQSYTYRVWADAQSPYIPYDGPQGTAATPHPTGLPDGYQEPFVAPNLVTLQNSPFSRNDPWLPVGATQTRGNNVDAYVDLVAPTGFSAGDLRGSLNGSGIFGDGYDLLLAPSVTDTQQLSSVAQIFFVTNFLHDWYYDSGFDEAAGNAQQDNYGRGGLEADVLRAEGQDYVGRNNANMSTPADGARPRMQMFVYDTRGLRVAEFPGDHPLAGRWTVGTSAFGPQQFDLTAPVVTAEDGVVGPEGTLADACEPLTNAAAVSGRILIVDRPGCEYTVKAAHAQAAGAVGLVIVNELGLFEYTAVSGRAPSITIPVVSALDFMREWLVDMPPSSLRLIRQGADRDGTLDNTIVAHEWMHYMSNRLIGDANGLTNNQGRSMGEGWSDFAGLLMIAREGDDQVPSNAGFGGVYARAAYANSGGANQGFYWGNRRYPYTTDLSKNPLTLRYIQNGVPLPEGIPVNFGQSGVNNAAVHSSGEVWAVMLWECYVSLLRDTGRLTFAQAQQRMRDYLVASLKLTPNAPTYLEARDAVLAAAYANDPADYILFANAFARRGAGTRAVVPDRESQDHVGVTESFSAGKDVVLASVELLEQTGSAASCDDDGVLDSGETVRVRVTLRNSGVERLTQTSVTLSSSTSDLSFPEGAVVSLPPVEPLQLVSVELPVRLSGPATPRTIGLTVAWRDQEQTIPGDQTYTRLLRVNTDELPGSSTVETVDSANHGWVLVPASVPRTSPWTRQSVPADASWLFHGPDNSTATEAVLVSPPLQVAPGVPFRFTLRHRYSFEEADEVTAFDGAVIELSEDDGESWVDIGQFLSPTYNSVILPNGDNPLSDRAAYSGESPGYPEFTTTVANLGSTHGGKTVRLRFVIGTDFTVGAPGWDLDELQFEGLANTPFTSLIAHRGQCINRAPVANAGPAQTLNERRRVTLSGSGTDPEGGALTYAWTQTGGPVVTLSSPSEQSPTFRAPEVTEDTDLVFELRVYDGVNASLPSQVTVRVRDISQGNRAPVASVVAAAPVDEGGSVTLVGSGTDVDEDVPLTYAWTQVGGPAVSLTDAASPSASFTAPGVASDTELAFQLVVSDGELASMPAVVTVQVRNTTPPNRAPVASVAAVAPVNEGGSVTLVGSGTDLDEDVPLTYAWTQVGGPAVTLTDAASPSTTFTAPGVASDTELAFQLVVSDAELASAPAVVTVLVRNVAINAPPVARAGDDQRVDEGRQVTLSGVGSTDPEGTALTHTWSQVSGPNVTLSTSGAEQTFTAPDVSADTSLTFRLQVTDAQGASSEDTVVVNVANVPVPKPDPDSGCGCSAGQEGSVPSAVVMMLAALGYALRRPRAKPVRSSMR